MRSMRNAEVMRLMETRPRYILLNKLKHQELECFGRFMGGRSPYLQMFTIDYGGN